ncbi:hypothetical protein ACLOJK_041431 [Asimina triloba]
MNGQRQRPAPTDSAVALIFSDDTTSGDRQPLLHLDERWQSRRPAAATDPDDLQPWQPPPPSSLFISTMATGSASPPGAY